jgi:hypothetical protein
MVFRTCAALELELCKPHDRAVIWVAYVTGMTINSTKYWDHGRFIHHAKWTIGHRHTSRVESDSDGQEIPWCRETERRLLRLQVSGHAAADNRQTWYLATSQHEDHIMLRNVTQTLSANLSNITELWSMGLQSLGGVTEIYNYIMKACGGMDVQIQVFLICTS